MIKFLFKTLNVEINVCEEKLKKLIKMEDNNNKYSYSDTLTFSDSIDEMPIIQIQSNPIDEMPVIKINDTTKSKLSASI